MTPGSRFVACVLLFSASVTLARAEGFIVGACTHFSQGKGVLEQNIESIK